MARERLESEAIAEGLDRLEGWTLNTEGNAIEKEFGFRNFSEAFAFMTRTAMAAEKLDHHPEWSNVYKSVKVKLSTHDAGGLTGLDFELARRMDKYAA